MEAIVVRSMQRNLVLLLLKFHFDDVYYARVVSDLEDAEIDAEGHKCHKRKEIGLDCFFDMRMSISSASLCLQF